MGEKVGKSRNTVFLQWIWGSGGSKSRLAKADGCGASMARWEMKICNAVVARSTFQVKMYKTHHSRTTFGSYDVEKVHAVSGAKHISKWKCTSTPGVSDHFWKLVMSKKCTPLWREGTFRSQNVQSTRGSDHFWKSRCWKSARRSGAKHISKSKCTKHTILGPLLEVEMLKKCTPLWREAHFQVKMYKTPGVRTTFGSCYWSNQ